MEGPPTSRMYSPDVGGAAWEPNAKIDNMLTSRRRFIMAGESTIYAGGEIAQVVGRDRRARRDLGHLRGRPARRPYQSAFTSPCTRSSHVCRFRMSTNLSPRTSASAGSGREL